MEKIKNLHFIIFISLFSIFDPSRKLNIINNWFTVGLVFTFFPYTFFFTNQWSTSISSLLLLLRKEARPLMIVRSEGYIFIISFFIIISFNITGLLPYILAPSRHLRISLPLGLTLWLRLIILGVWEKLNHLFSHLVPLGCPISLIFFIVIIESISIIIRPITLSVRLSANIMAGHVILALISSFSFMEPSLFMVRLFVQLILFTLETSVALVQPYVFFTLLSLYKEELD